MHPFGLPMNDFHSHLGRTRSGDANDAHGLHRDLTAHGIGKVAVCSMSQYSMQENNDLIADAMHQYPEFVEGVAFIDPKAPDAMDEVNRTLGDLRMNGVKFMPWKHGYNAENCPQIGPVLDEIGKYGVHVQIHGGAAPLCTPYVWIEHAKKRHHMRFVFTHICGREFGSSCIDRIQDVPNFWVETSANHELPILQKAAQKLGAKRILMGTDWPYKPTSVEIKKLFHLGFSDEELDLVLRANAEELWAR